MLNLSVTGCDVISHDEHYFLWINKMARGRPRKIRVGNDDGQCHKTVSFTDWNVCPAREEHYRLVSQECAKFVMSKEYGTQAKDSMKVDPDVPGSRPHYQGQITSRYPHRWAYWAKWFEGVHFEFSKCEYESLYEMKVSSELVIYHNSSQQGKRVVFAEQKDKIKEGATLRECADLDGANYQSLRSAQLLMQFFEPDRGCKDRDVIQAFSPSEECGYVVTDIDNWFGYDGHKTVFLDMLRVPKKRRSEVFHKYTSSSSFRVRVSGYTMRQAMYDKIYVLNYDGWKRVNPKNYRIPSPW